jgi:hypothetical protein
MGSSGDKGKEIGTLRGMEVFTNFYKDAKYKHEKQNNYFSFMVKKVKETTFRCRKLMEFAVFSFFFFFFLLLLPLYEAEKSRSL